MMIQPASLFDVRAVYAVQRQSFGRDAYPYPDLALLLLLPGMINLKAVNEAGMVIGFVSGARAWLPWSADWIMMLCVANDWRRQGIGRRLLTTCESRLNLHRLHLTVRADNTAARLLYQSQGYEQMEVRRRYYRDGEDGIIMVKRTMPGSPIIRDS